MRLLLWILTAVLLVPATAVAGTLSFPALPDDRPRGMAVGTDGRGAVVLQNGGSHALVDLRDGTRRELGPTRELDRVQRADGGVDMLVRTEDPLRHPQLAVRRVRPSGRLYGPIILPDVDASVGAIARGRDRTVFAWSQGGRLRLHSLIDGVIASKTYTVALAAGRPTDLALGIDDRGRLTLAAMTARGLVVAAIDRRGRVLRRQVFSRVEGLVSIAVTPGGRVGVLAEDTGIEGEVGECVSDGAGRHVRVVVRERLAKRFGAPQTIESPPFGCGSGGALLRATRGEGLTAIYQAGSYDHPPLRVKTAVARRAQRFGGPLTMLDDARSDTAVVTKDGELVVGLLRRTTSPEVFSGSLTVFHAPDAYVQVDPGPAFSPLLALDAAGDDVLAWRTDGALHVVR